MSEENTKIPKIIHYCWFGNNPKSELIEKCILSWKKYLPDYELREWNDEDLKNCKNQYVQEALECKKYAFISDYFRLYALYNYGGIYLDTDNEIFKTLDEFLDLDFFSGYEVYNDEIVYEKVSPFTAVVGSKKGNQIIKDLLDEYNDIHFIKPNGEMDITPNTDRVTNYFKQKYNLTETYNPNQKLVLEDNCIIYPANYFCNYKKNVSYAVHHFNATWLEYKPKKKKLSFLQQIFSITNANQNKRVIKFLGFKITISKNKKIDKYKFFSSGENIIIQDNCRIYHSKNISIGNNVVIGQCALIEGMGNLKIGNNVILGPDVTIWTANHNYFSPELLPFDEKVINKPVHIKDNVWIGAKAIITPGVTIEEGAVVGMGAVVAKDVPKGAVVCGNPAKIVKYRDINKYNELIQQNAYYLDKKEAE